MARFSAQVAAEHITSDDREPRRRVIEGEVGRREVITGAPAASVVGRGASARGDQAVFRRGWYEACEHPVLASP